MYDISIVIVSWNARQHLLNCLKSIRDTAENLSIEIIVVDNASADGSPETVVRQFPNVHLIRNDDNLGFAKGNNIGIRRSKGRYMCLINSDVIVQANCLEEMLSFMDDHPRIGMMGPRLSFPDGRFQASCRRLPTLWASFIQAFGLHMLFPRSGWFPEAFMTRNEHTRVRDVEVLSGAFWMVRREALDQVGGLDERFFLYGEDKDWCKRFADADWRIVYYPRVAAVHVGAGSSTSDPTRFSLEQHKAQFIYWRKHKGRFGQASYTVVALLHNTLRLLSWGVLYVGRASDRDNVALKIRRSVVCLRWLLHI